MTSERLRDLVARRLLSAPLYRWLLTTSPHRWFIRAREPC
jgi:hypothetical protein